MHPGTPASDEDEELVVATAGLKVAIPHKSIKVAHEANELWKANLKLREHWLVMVEKQVAQDEHLIGAVQALMVALSCADLVPDSAQGRVVGGMGKGRPVGKGKGRANPQTTIEHIRDDT